MYLTQKLSRIKNQFNFIVFQYIYVMQQSTFYFSYFILYIHKKNIIK